MDRPYITKICDLQSRRPRENYRRNGLPPVEPCEQQAAGIDGDIPVEAVAMPGWTAAAMLTLFVTAALTWIVIGFVIWGTWGS
jgi:hypothetical protein